MKKKYLICVIHWICQLTRAARLRKNIHNTVSVHKKKQKKKTFKTTENINKWYLNELTFSGLLLNIVSILKFDLSMVFNKWPKFQVW